MSAVPRPRKKLRFAAILMVIGLICEALALADLTPETFMVFAVIGAPCIIASMLVYLAYVLRNLRRKDAL